MRPQHRNREPAMTAEPARPASRDEPRVPVFAAAYAPADEDMAADLLRANAASPPADAAIDARARRLVTAIRARRGGIGGIEDLLHEYSLSTKEGLALMVLAEALLRVSEGA